QQHGRNLQLLPAGGVSKQDVDTTAANLKAALAHEKSLSAQIAQEQSNLQGDVANLGYTKIYAPISGTVISTTAPEGQTVNASQQAPTIVELANLDIMTVWAQVAEADVSRLRAGMQAYFTTLGSDEHRWYGTVAQILPAPETINNVVLYDTLIDIEN